MAHSLQSSVRPTEGPVSARSLDAWLLHRLAARIKTSRLAYATDAAFVPAAERPPLATLRLHGRQTFLGLLANPELFFGDAFAEGRIDIEGDLVGALEAAYRSLEDEPVHLRDRLQARKKQTPSRARRNIHSHYDLSNDFYGLWLDRELVYSCAYFDRPDASLEEAQIAKMDHICRKLGLRSGETVIDIGSGWGSLALHMARRWGVRAIGCNVSHEQVRYARERARREGLADRVEFLEEDYRRIDRRCDALVSVGMLEHVGRQSMVDFGHMMARCVRRDGGRGLLHFIGRDRPRPINAWIARNVFPGGYIPTLDEVTRDALATAHCSVVDVENLRFHYARTLHHWRLRYERAVAQGRVGFDERFRRLWRLYLAGSEAAFRAGSLQLFQVTFAPSDAAHLPWTRERLYDGSPGLEWGGEGAE